jgi:hypothetical protein
MEKTIFLNENLIFVFMYVLKSTRNFSFLYYESELTDDSISLFTVKITKLTFFVATNNHVPRSSSLDLFVFKSEITSPR